MKITILCSNKDHPIYPYLVNWMLKNIKKYEISLVSSKREVREGDILFLISCSEIIGEDIRQKFKNVLVIHASDLPYGRGWSPHIWELVNGAKRITVSLLEAEDKVDSGRIWHKLCFDVEDHELWSEINQKLFLTELELMNYALDNYENIIPYNQPDDVEPTYYRRRQPDDSMLDPNQSISSQFNLIRVCDPERFPAFFYLNGYKYALTLTKIS
ncbi:formyltransferase family protein [Pelistega sp. MC2]|uniref:formyltransferase family protein n=1 Tax=Pelistega sp. MC2 TaxID=1720297 RepID=UPI0008DAA5DF|nr:formyltransferase family protein [Pelistega sp. MC2]